MTWTEYLVMAARKSRWDFGLWVRYLNKVIHREEIFLSAEDIDFLLHSPALTSYQRIFLELACQKDTAPWEMTVSLSEPARCSHLQAVLAELSK